MITHNLKPLLMLLKQIKVRGKGKYNTCTHCGKLGHTIDICYKKHGFPPYFKFKNGNPANNMYSE